MNRSKLIFFSAITCIFLLVPTKAIGAVNSSTQALEQQAKVLYEQNKYREAINLLKTAINSYQTTGDRFSLAIAYRNLALVYQKLGQWQQAATALSQAETIATNLNNEDRQDRLLAQILEVKGQINLSLGKPQQALDVWQQAISLYEQHNDLTDYIKVKIYQTSALQELGLYSQAIANLTKIKIELENKPNDRTKLQALLNLSDVLTRTGQYKKSQQILETCLTIAKQLKQENLTAEVFLNLGNNARSQNLATQALNFYRQALVASSDSDLRLRANLNLLETFIYLERENAVQKASEIEQFLSQSSNRKTTAQAKVSLARYLIQLDAQPQQVVSILVEAIEQAKALEIPQIESEALGVLGNLYEQNQQWQEAAKITERALLIAQNINAKELIYQWQWQLGRIFKAQGNTEPAILAYTQATNNLQTLRSDLVAVSSDLQYSFREKIEPVYRELAALLLQPGASQANLNRARQTIESLQVAELDNFFRDACLDTQPVAVEEVDSAAAVLHTIIVGDRLEVIAAIPGKPLKHYSYDLPPSEIEIVVTSANSSISNPFRLDLSLLQQAYDWLIRPIEAELQAEGIQTLVFVPDGVLRNLPPATLHDGKQYLIENYSVAIAPSLQLAQLESKPPKGQDILLAGLSESRQGFASLPGVKQEIQQIEALFVSDVLFNDSFTEFNFNRSANQTPFRIVHLATHGQFGSNTEDTFILTWDDRINIEELNQLLRGDSKQLRPVDLLVLSACETATGDRNSALGLAGIAVRGGARTTIASLWAVSDRATVALMTNFYRELAKNNITKAEALRRAQQMILNSEYFSHPFYWSAFILVGNWQ